MNRGRFAHINDAELRTILQASADTSQAIYLMVLLMILTGQRAMEVLKLEWDQIDLKHALWHRAPDGKLKRQFPPLPLSTLTVRILTYLGDCNGQTGRVLCQKGREEGLRRHANREINRQILLSTGSTLDWTIHRLRRTFARGCYVSGASQVQLSLILGHRFDRVGEKIFSSPQDIMSLCRPLLECWSLHIEDLLAPEGVNFDCLGGPAPALRRVK